MVLPDGNGRVGRLILFKECLKYHIIPFIIEDQWKMFYYRSLKEWENERGYLRDTCHRINIRHIWIIFAFHMKMTIVNADFLGKDRKNAGYRLFQLRPARILA